MDGMNIFPQEIDYRAERKVFSKMGLTYTAVLVVVSAMQLALGYNLQLYFPWIGQEHYWLYFVICMLPTYLVGYPIAAFFMKKGHNVEIERRKLKVKDYLVFLCMSACLLVAGSIIGNFVNAGIEFVTGIEIRDDLSIVMNNSTLWANVVVACILAPIFEELMFRKLICDKTARYGEGIAIVVSGVAFGLFHGNFSQFFYAAFIGCLFAYIYLKTGNVKYTISIHILINLGSTLMAPVYSKIDESALNMIPQAGVEINSFSDIIRMFGSGNLYPVVVLMVYSGVLYTMAFIGFLMFGILWRRMRLKAGEITFTKGRKFSTVFWNFGVIIYTLVCLGLFVYTIFSM